MHFVKTFGSKLNKKATKIQSNDFIFRLTSKAFTHRNNGNLNDKPILKFHKTWLFNVNSTFATKMLTKKC